MVASWLDDHMCIQDNIDEYVSMQSQPITVVLLQIAPPHVTSSHTPFKAVQELFSGMSSLSGIRHCVGKRSQPIVLLLHSHIFLGRPCQYTDVVIFLGRLCQHIDVLMGKKRQQYDGGHYSRRGYSKDDLVKGPGTVCVAMATAILSVNDITVHHQWWHAACRTCGICWSGQACAV